MVGAGMAAQAMINSLKNNALLKGKRKRYFDKERSYYNTRSSGVHKLLEKEATPELLEEIRSKLLKERRKAIIKNTFIFILSIIITIFIFAYIQINYLSAS